MRKRWWMFRIVDLILALTPRGRDGGVLIVRMDGIGDMVLFRPFLDHYAEALGVGTGDLTVLGCKSWGSLADTIFGGYRTELIHEKRFEKSLTYRLKIARRLKRAGYDTVICGSYFRKTLMHDSLVRACGAPRTIVTRPHLSEKTAREFGWYLGQCGEVVETGEHPTHELTRHQRFLEHLAGKPLPPVAFTMPWRDQAPPVGEGAPYAVLNFGSNEPGRNWPLENYFDLARRLLDSGKRVVFVGGNNEKRVKPLLQRDLDHPGVVDLIGETSLPELMDTLNHAALVVTNETGPGHLALILGTPTVMIYGGGHASSFMPYPESHRRPGARFVNHEMPCYHCLWICDKREAEDQAFPCVAAVGVDAVWDEIGVCLAEAEGARPAAPQGAE